MKKVMTALAFSLLTQINSDASLESQSHADALLETIASGVFVETQCTEPNADLTRAAWALAVTASAEARSEGVVGMALTIEVMVNRMCADSSIYGGQNARSVVTHPWAFSVYNYDSLVRDELIGLLDTPLSGSSEIALWAREAFPIAKAALQGWRTGLLPNHDDGCRHYLTTSASAIWEKSKPDLIYRNHEFHCWVDQ